MIGNHIDGYDTSQDVRVKVENESAPSAYDSIDEDAYDGLMTGGLWVIPAVAVAMAFGCVLVCVVRAWFV